MIWLIDRPCKEIVISYWNGPANGSVLQLSHAQPAPCRQVLSLDMQGLPQALPLEQVLQQPCTGVGIGVQGMGLGGGLRMTIGAATSAAASDVKIFIAPSQAHANQSAGRWKSRVCVQEASASLFYRPTSRHW